MGSIKVSEGESVVFGSDVPEPLLYKSKGRRMIKIKEKMAGKRYLGFMAIPPVFLV
jgi:hypothetical protein